MRAGFGTAVAAKPQYDANRIDDGEKYDDSKSATFLVRHRGRARRTDRRNRIARTAPSRSAIANHAQDAGRLAGRPHALRKLPDVRGARRQALEWPAEDRHAAGRLDRACLRDA